MMLRRSGAVETQQQVRGGEVKEAQRVRLDDLAAVHRFAQLRGRRRDAHAHDGVAGLGRGQKMADRADPQMRAVIDGIS